MQVIPIHHLFKVLESRARADSVTLPSLVAVSRTAFFAAKAGGSFAHETALQFIVAARAFISPDIVGIIDGAGRKYLADDYLERAEAELRRLRDEVITLRRFAWNRLRTFSL